MSDTLVVQQVVETISVSDTSGTVVTVIQEQPNVVSVGEQGAPGVGISRGGTTGDVLVKESAADYDTGWTPLGTLGGDKTFSQAFSNVSTVTVNHNLGKNPAVTVIDTANDEVEGAVNYVTANQLTISFSASTSGMVTCN